MKRTKYYLSLLVVVCVAFLAPAAWASPILVSNFSFESTSGTTASCGVGCSYDIGAISGWTNGGVTGQFTPPASPSTFFDAAIPDGSTVAFSNGGAITQTVGSVVMPGVVYTLTVNLGLRKDDSTFDGAADLLINGNTYASAGVVPTSGNWALYTATYVGTDADAGQSITIELKALNLGSQQADFDNVHLDASAPEPASLGLAGAALVGLALLLRKRNVKSTFRN